MRYEQTKKLSNRHFKRLVGVQRHTFDEIVKVLQDTASLKQTLKIIFWDGMNLRLLMNFEIFTSDKIPKQK